MRPISRRALLEMFPLPMLAAAVRAGAQTAMTVYKDPTCGCCTKWVDLLRREGFAVTVVESRDITGIKDKYKVPQAARSCHTATMNGYVIEGHVPPADIKRLLKERPAVLGLAVPGMPIGGWR